MSGYSNHSQFSNADHIGLTNTTRGNDYNTNANVNTPGPSAIHNHGIAVGGPAPTSALAPLRSVVQTMPSTAMQHQPQSLLYDMSSFDPLQAQALQLSASAGLTTADILAAVAAPGMVAAPNGTPSDGNSHVALGATTNTTPVATGIPHPATSYSQLLSHQAQASTHGAPAPIVGAPIPMSRGQLQPIQPIPAAPPATATQHPYIFIQPQHQLAPNATAVAPAATATTFAKPTTAAPNSLLVPAPATGSAAASLAASTQAVAAAAAGLGAHPFLLNPALFTTAAAQGVTGLTHIHQHHTQPSLATQKQEQAHHGHVSTASNLAPTLILPSINPHQALSQTHSQSKKRPLGSGLLMNEIAPSVVSSATAPVIDQTKWQRGGQSKRANTQELKAEDPAEKRRYERNLREQQRSSKISSQIKELREVLSDCNVPFKPNKYSILLKVVEYIKQLQSRAIMLDAEHQKLITTVRQTNEMITNAANNNGMSSTTCGATDNESSDTTCQDAWQQGDRMRGTRRGDSDLCFVKGIDYRSVFEQCPTAFGIAALDGRILECNVEFQNLLGYNAREELLKQSLFNLVHNHQDIFRAMAQMLKTAEEPTPKNATANAASGANGDNDNSMDRFWTGPVTSKQNINVSELLQGLNRSLAGHKVPDLIYKSTLVVGVLI